MKEKSLNLGKTKTAVIRSISEVYFGYNIILEVSPHLAADINKLYGIASSQKYEKQNKKSKRR